MLLSTPPSIPTGSFVRIEQQISHRDGQWQTVIEGTVLSHKLEPTGSWFAHGRNDKLWLNRIRLQKSDGEITTVNLDRNSKITLLQPNKS